MANLMRAVVRLHRRAEDDEDSVLVATFVDIGLLSDLLTKTESQVIYGRRGTGKTHALKYLQDQVQSTAGTAIYVDMRKIGSTGGIYADPNLPLHERATRLLLDVLGVMHEGLVDVALQRTYAGDDIGNALAILDELAAEITSTVRVSGPVEVTSKHSESTAMGRSAELGAEASATPVIKASYGTTGSRVNDLEQTIHRSGAEVHRVHFGALTGYVERAVRALELDPFMILLDEWSSIPLELQPYLADLLRRSLFTIRGVAVKIAAIEQRSTFKLDVGPGDYIGIELGADAPADIDLDDFMVFGNDAVAAKTFFQNLLWRKVIAQLEEDDDSEGAPATADEFVAQFFTQTATFEEFVRASEGVPRDAINILSLAAQKSTNARSVSVPVLRNGARLWYLRDKQKGIAGNEGAEALLNWIMEEVLDKRQTRSFLLLQGDEAHPIIRDLHDSRLLHMVKRNIAARDQPGTRFNGWSLDYGCYVDLISTTKAPRGALLIDDEDGTERFVDIDVPLDDYRSIRRSILSLGDFEARPVTLPFVVGAPRT